MHIIGSPRQMPSMSNGKTGRDNKSTLHVHYEAVMSYVNFNHKNSYIIITMSALTFSFMFLCLHLFGFSLMFSGSYGRFLLVFSLFLGLLKINNNNNNNNNNSNTTNSFARDSFFFYCLITDYTICLKVC